MKTLRTAVAGTTSRGWWAWLVLPIVAGMLLTGCDEEDPISADGIAGPAKSPVGNVAPETYLTLQLPEGELPDTSRSAKTLNWWGEDVDGRVTGYEYRWGKIEYDGTGTPTDTSWYDTGFSFVSGDQEVWTETTSEEVDFVLPIRSVSATFVVLVRAVDNESVVDPTPASIAFPIINSRPSITFREGSNPIQTTGNEEGFLDSDTSYTFPVRTFVWDATDPDGNASIEKILYALDPLPGDTTWEELGGTESSVTLRDIEPGQHVFFVKVVDVAGFESPAIHWPAYELDPDDPDLAARVWTVKEPAPGGFLIVDDYYLERTGAPTQYYADRLEDVFGGPFSGEDDLYSVWDLKVLPYATIDVTESVLYFDNVIWYSYLGSPALFEALAALYTFIDTPGKRMLISSREIAVGEDQTDPGMLLELATDIELNGTRIGGREADEEDPLYLQGVDVDLPDILIAQLLPTQTWGLLPTDQAEIVYRLDPSTRPNPQYEGQPIVGIRRPDKSYTLITLPIHLAAEPGPVNALIENTFAE